MMKIFKGFSLYESMNKLRHLAAMFFNGSEIFEQSCQRVPQGTFVQNNFQIGPVLLDKKIFKVLTMHI